MASIINADNGVVSGSAGLKTSADSTGVLALQTNGTTAVTVNTSQNVGIGTTTPNAKLTVSNGGVQALEFSPTGSTGGGAYIQGYNRSTFVYTPVEIIASSFAVYPQGGASKINVNFNGLGLGTGTPSSGIGITFPATQDPSSNANTLDDYEEGTFTPSLGDSASGVATMSVQEGKYVKVGKIVQFSLQIVWTAKNTWTGTNTKISGLPFAATSNTGAYYWPNPATMSCNLTTTAFNYAIEANQTYGYIMTLLIGQIVASDFPSSGRAIINGVYQTA
jgi:hypothetical protein